MSRKIFVRKLSTIAFFVFSGVLFFSFATEHDPFVDRKVAEKYGLNIPSPFDENEPLEPAPEWFRKIDMSTSNRGVWRDYEFNLKDTLITRKVRTRNTHSFKEVTEHYPVEIFGSFDYSLVEGVPLISHVPHSKKAFEEARKQGVKVIPYLHFRDIHTNYADQDVFIFQHPEILVKDLYGKWAHLPMDGSYRMHRLLTCANSPSYWKLSLAYVKKIMDWGADGIFIDNVEPREPCSAHRFNHVRNPEFEDSYIEHEHLFPDATHDYAWDRMLQAIRDLVKSYGEDKIVVLNPGLDSPVQKNGDACMWESFIYSWGWEGRRHAWGDVKRRAQENKWYLDAGRRIIAMSYLTRGEEAKDDAFWAFSAARLVDFIWHANVNGTGAEVLYRAHMGKALDRFKEADGVAWRMFENGLIVLNDSMDDQLTELTFPADFHADRLLDLYNGSQIIRLNSKKVEVAVPGKSARVFMVPEQSS